MKHNNLTHKPSQITQIVLFLNTQIIYTELHQMIILQILQKYIPRLLAHISAQTLVQNPKFGINGKTLTGRLAMVSM